MTEKDIENRVDKLEQSAHIHRAVEQVDCNPEKAEIHKLKLKEADVEKAKRSGKIHGDPILIIE
jgi:PIN domain nuclease of toxin-antitoxin system